MLMGNYQSFNPSGEAVTLYKPIPEELNHMLLCGKDCFIRLMETDTFPPMIWTYIYRNEYLRQSQSRFEEGIVYEDELWTVLTLCNASRIFISGIDFYEYRQREGSITQTKNAKRRLTSTVRVANRLMEFADGFDFSGEDSEFKNWLYVRIFGQYSAAFRSLSHIKDATFVLPENYLMRFREDCRAMMPWPLQICNYHYQNAETELRIYADRMNSDVML